RRFGALRSLEQALDTEYGQRSGGLMSLCQWLPSLARPLLQGSPMTKHLALLLFAAFPMALLECTVSQNEDASKGSNALGANLMAAYAFDEGSGGTTADASGNGHTGTVNVATWTTGKYGHALSFKGASWVRIPKGASLDNKSPFTYCAWINPHSMG